jgi:hypothetical protein
VKKRALTDQIFISSKNLSDNEVLTWLTDLFKGSRAVTNAVPEYLVDWMLKIVLQNYAQGRSNEKTMCLYKALHTHEVLQAGCDILQKSNEEIPDISKAYTCVILHDIGRFPQAVITGNLLDAASKFDHGDLGAKMLTEEYPNLTDVIKAVKWHNKITYPYNNVYAKFTRDADKLSNVRHAGEMFSIMGSKNGAVSPVVLNMFLNKEIVSYQNLINKSDFYVNMLSWNFDLNFAATKNIFDEEQLVDKLLKLIKADDPCGYETIKKSCVLNF